MLIKAAKYNLFNLKSRDVTIDLLTDSGTGSMSNRQWSAIMMGDESYAGSESYHELKKVVQQITGYDYFLPTHQGRAAENVLFSVLVGAGNVVPGNAHFDTTKGHIEFRKAYAIDCIVDEAADINSDFPFKGNIDLAKLERVIAENGAEKIPCIILTITCNSVGGQPVSMQNIRQVSALAKRQGIHLFFDGARFAENAYFIKQRETAYADKTIKEIVWEMLAYGDGMMMSSKKDGLVNTGGFIALNDKDIYEKASVFNIMYEGFISYGGMAGRDMAALAVGLDEATEFEYLNARIQQVEYLCQKLHRYGVPVQRPCGGHAVYIDAGKMLPHIPRKEFPAQTLAIELFVESGIRGVEIGAILADRDPITRENRYPTLDLLRLAIPRRVYTRNHMDYIAIALKNIFERRDSYLAGVKIIKEAPVMRHFTIELERLNGKTISEPMSNPVCETTFGFTKAY